MKFISAMVSIYYTSQGWALVRSENLGYYTSLGDVMDAAYAATNGQKYCYKAAERLDDEPQTSSRIPTHLK